MSRNTLSANTLFHFTKEMLTLESILTNGFYPRYCMEKFDYVDYVREREFPMPMVCFCDIPLSEIVEHKEQYGEYAIGMSKDWGKVNGINPLIYTTAESIPTKMLNEIINGLYNKEKVLLEYGKMVQFMTAYMKPYEGYTWNKNTNSFDGKWTTFYNEREWRYVPKDLLGDNWLFKDAFLDDDKRKVYNDRVEKFKLKFNPNDIKYIIVKSDDEVIDMVDKIMTIYKDKYTQDDLIKLTTRILSMDRVLEDF